MQIPEQTDEQVIAKYAQSEPLYALTNGGQVLGHEVDIDNRLIYVIKKDEVIYLDYALNCTPIGDMPKGTQVVKTVDIMAPAD